MAQLLEEKQFDYKGYTCIVRKTGFKFTNQREKEILESLRQSDYWYCGYVRIPTNQPLHGVDYNDLYEEENRKKYGDIDCHGGLTYSRMENDTEWTIGFDCNHYQDNPIEHNEEYTMNECRRIVDQLEKIELEKGARHD